MPCRQTPKMQARKLARRRSFIQAATRLFGKRGYHATTVPDIVAAAGGSTGSFYLHFRNKEDVFAAALEDLNARLNAVFERARVAATGPLEQIRNAVIALFVFLARRPREARLLVVESSGLSPALEAVRRRLLAAHVEKVRSIIEGHPECFSSADAVVAARCLVGAVFENVYAWLETPRARRAPPLQLAAAVAEYNLRALCWPPSK